MNYGTKCSGRFLHYYGFLPATNSYESVLLDLVLAPADPMLVAKKLVADSLVLRRLPFFPDADYLCYPNDKVMSYLRFIEFSGDVALLNQVFADPHIAL